MPSKRKFYKTVITVTVLGEEYYGDAADLGLIYNDITNGDCSGRVENQGSVEVDGPTMAALLLGQDSDPGFFQLTDQGEDTNEAEEENDVGPNPV